MQEKKSWKSALAVYREPLALRFLLLGFSAGLPLLLVLGTLAFWLSEVGVDVKTIGFMSWVGLCWALKWIWAPLVDTLPIPFLTACLGRRRSWLLVSQIGIIVALCAMALTDPAQHLSSMIVFALLTAFSSATQDIVLDAYRIESAQGDEQAALAATYQLGYRIAMIWTGAGALFLASWAELFFEQGWTTAYLIMALTACIGPMTVIFSPEPAVSARMHPAYTDGVKAWLASAVLEPFTEFFRRFGASALVILALIATYRISDVVMGIMANPFYFQMGFSKAEVASVSKVFGVIMTLVGALVGGLISSKMGVMKTLFFGGFLAAITNLAFVALAYQGHDLAGLILAVSADNLAGGIASVAFVAYLSGLTSPTNTATQYAIFASLMLLLPKFLAGFSGVVVESFGYPIFFTSTALIGIPVLVLVYWAGRISPKAQ